MFDKIESGAKSLGTAGLNFVGGGAISALGNAVSGIFGSGNSDPAARARADAMAGKLIRLGTPLEKQKSPATAAAPVDGTYYLFIENGSIWQSKAAGLYAVPDSWAQERTALWNAAKTNVPDSHLQAGLNSLPLLIGLGIVLAVAGK